ncbi:MAG: response regulator [Gammaproteobacteria bacterium]|nr:response regulator [Gammaproteobacteria bacterium]MBI5616167.1 response regulator [Gammaproteobacteria bacterium]
MNATERILFVDDQPEVIDLIERQLGHSYECVFARSGAEALRQLDAGEMPAVVVADYSMPNMDGVTLLGEIRKRAPGVVPIMLTAHAKLDVAISALHEARVFRFLRKPWQREEFEHAIAAALDHHHLLERERRLKEELLATNRALDAKVEELKETNQLLEFWVEFSPAVLYSADIVAGEINYTYVGKNFARLAGYERTELRRFPELWHSVLEPEALVLRAEMLGRIAAGESRDEALHYRIRHRSGKQRRIVEAVHVLGALRGSTVEIAGSWLDVTGAVEAVSAP